MLQIHEKIVRARLSAGLTQDELAEKIGIKRSTYQYWEDKPPSIEKVKLVAKALGLDEDYFFVEQDETQTKDYSKESLLIKLNEEYSDRIAEMKLRFVNMERLMVNLNQLTERQAMIEAQVELAVDLLTEVHPILRKIKDPQEAAHELDKRLAPKIEKALKRGTHSGTGTENRS